MTQKAMTKNDKILTAYCLSYGNWTVIPKQWQESFMDMRDKGFDAVALSFSESEMRYSRRTLELQIKYAHAQGLKVYLIPSRIGGRFAGAPLMPCLWLVGHPEYQLPECQGVACLESPGFRQWALEFVSILVREYDIDGIIWDEPKCVATSTCHPDTISRFGGVPTAEQAQDGFIDFLAELTVAVRIRPNLDITLFNMPNTPAYFTARAAKISGIDYCGFDGVFSRQSCFHEEPRQNKNSLISSWQRTVSECSAAEKKTFALIENILIPGSEHDKLQEELELFLNYADPDHLACYYYGHNNECPDEVQRITMNAVCRHRSNSRSSFSQEEYKIPTLRPTGLVEV